MGLFGIGENKKKVGNGKKTLNEKITIIENIIFKLIESLDSLRVLKNSTSNVADVMKDLKVNSNEYDSYLSRIKSLLLMIFQNKKISSKEQLKIIQEISNLFDKALIKDDYVLTEAKYSFRIECLNSALKKLKELEKLENKKLTSIKSGKKPIVNNEKEDNDYVKAA